MIRSVIIGLGVFSATAACAQTFPFDGPTYKAKVSQQLKADGDDPVKTCARKDTSLICTFEGTAFAKSVAGMKALNLLNGTFDDKSMLIIILEGKKVAKIMVKGDRSDPVNMLRTIGQVGSVLQSVGVPKEKAQSELKELGLMRGDDDPSIGTPKNDILTEVAITCNNLPSSNTTTFGCVLEPRY